MSMNGGLEHAVLSDANGQVWDWGKNTSGQLGDGTYASTSVPQQVTLPTTIKEVAAGQEFTLALSSDGEHVYAWGDNTKGELGIGNASITNSDVPLPVDIDLPANTTITSIGDGGNGGFAVLSNGDVMGWGANEHGQAGQSPTQTDIFTPAVIPNLSDVVSVAAGDHQTLALKADGTVWALGANRYGQLGPNGPTPTIRASTDVPVEVTGLPTIVAIATGGEDSLALDAEGNLWSWGRNGFGELGRGTISTSDGPHSVPEKVVGLSNIVSIDGEGPTTLAADASGNVYAWGFNRQGEVGDGSRSDTGTPQLVLTVPVSPGSPGPSVQVAAGHWFSYAFDSTTGQTFAWGKNQYGELGSAANELLNDEPSKPGGLFGSIVHDPLGAAGQVYALYEAILGHAPDPLGLEQRTADIEGGAQISSVARSILSLPEYQGAHGSFESLSDSAFVTALYEADFQRAPTGAESDAWLTDLKDDGSSRPHVAVEIALSPESLAGINGAFQSGVFVPDAGAASIARLYYGLLDRAPDATDLGFYETAAASGTSLKAIAAQLIDSPEYAILHGPQTNIGFVQALFEAATGAAGSAAATQPYVEELNRGVASGSVAFQIAESPAAAAHLESQIEIGKNLA